MAILTFIANILFEIICWFETRIRLCKIEKAFGIKFNRTQRKWLLHCKDGISKDIDSWPRRSGKTACAIAWDLLYLKRPNPFEKNPETKVVSLRNFYIPDPDLFKHGASYYRDLYIQYIQAYFSCAAHGLSLIPVDFQPGHSLHPVFTDRKDGMRHE